MSHSEAVAAMPPRPQAQAQDLPDRTSGFQVCCSLMLTIQVMPNLSVHMPNTSPHIERHSFRGRVTALHGERNIKA